MVTREVERGEASMEDEAEKDKKGKNKIAK